MSRYLERITTPGRILYGQSRVIVRRRKNYKRSSDGRFLLQIATTAQIDIRQNDCTTFIMTTRTPTTMEARSNVPYTAVRPSADRASIWLCSLDANSYQEVQVLPGIYGIKFDASKQSEQVTFTAYDRRERRRTDIEPVRLTCSPVETIDDSISVARLKAFSTCRRRDIDGGVFTASESLTDQRCTSQSRRMDRSKNHRAHCFIATLLTWI